MRRGGATLRACVLPVAQGGTEVAFEDKTLTCRDCSGSFVFTAGEQGFYLEKGLLNEPQRCPTCRANRRRDRSNGGRELTSVTCASQARSCSGTSGTWPSIHSDPSDHTSFFQIGTVCLMRSTA